MTSRSFGKMVSDINTLKAAISYFISKGSYKLRKQHSKAGSCIISIRSNRFREDLKQTHQSRIINFPFPTNDSIVIAHVVMRVVEELFEN